MTDHSQLVKRIRWESQTPVGAYVTIPKEVLDQSADAIDALQADAYRSEIHRNDLYDKIVSQRTEMNALTNERNAAERERDTLQARVEALEAGLKEADLRQERHENLLGIARALIERN